MILGVVVSKLRIFSAADWTMCQVLKKKGSDTYGSNVGSGIHWMMCILMGCLFLSLRAGFKKQRLQHRTRTGDSSHNRTLGKTHVPGDSK